MNPKVSIIIPSKNSAQTIKKLLESIFTNHYDKNFSEVIVIDASNDNTPKILKEFPARLFKIPFMSQRNVAICRNIGISKARGNFIYFLDSDSFLEKNWQIHLKKAIKSEIPIFGGQISTKGNFFDFYCENSIKSPMRHVKKTFRINKANFYMGLWPLAGNMCVKKEVFKKIGKFDKNMENYEEVDFLWRACCNDIDIEMLPAPNAIHSYGKNIVEGMKTYFRYGNGFGKFAMKYPTSFLSISKSFFIFSFLILTFLFFFSLIFANGNLPYFLMPLVGMFAYYLTRKKFDMKLLLLPIFDLLYIGISYNMGVLQSIFKQMIKTH